MALTSLAGTKWIFNSIINFDETYQTYVISFVFNDITGFEISADIMSVDGPALKILYSDSQVYNNEWEHEEYRTISINDGIDITNTRLIAWLEANATNITPLSDLTGTTWVLNSALNSYPDQDSTKTYFYSVDIITAEYPTTTLSNIHHYSFSAIQINPYNSNNNNNNNTINFIRPFNFSSIPLIVATGHTTTSLPDPWTSYYDKPFTITGGIDVTNSSLIAWLQENATMVTPDVSVSYNDKMIAILSGSKTRTLDTSGKYCTGDITLNYTKPSFITYYTGVEEPDSELGEDGDVYLRWG